MSKAIFAEARELILLITMLAGLSSLSLALACGAVFIADAQSLHAADIGLSSPMGPLTR